jgi:hypothetical protein
MSRSYTSSPLRLHGVLNDYFTLQLDKKNPSGARFRSGLIGKSFLINC